VPIELLLLLLFPSPYELLIFTTQYIGYHYVLWPSPLLALIAY